MWDDPTSPPAHSCSAVGDLISTWAAVRGDGVYSCLWENPRRGDSNEIPMVWERRGEERRGEERRGEERERERRGEERRGEERRGEERRGEERRGERGEERERRGEERRGEERRGEREERRGEERGEEERRERRGETEQKSLWCTLKGNFGKTLMASLSSS
ncbi:hypothetical protein DUI87_10339 [Hirundo rustica rustica]|uniref:Uncharacterized protein n=1 Tax=Hirundo rustica rustica TaxID=333673 RepID=A0A3M0KNJ2_HIRRU|nr:hypothetical protein DUI87_10339 [Hirundo rustica rustica]